jgi:hypothetical protein
MATAYHNLSDYDFNSVPSAENMKFGIVIPFGYYNAEFHFRSIRYRAKVVI